MWAHKTQAKGKRRSSWKVLMPLAGLAALFIGISLAMAKRASQQKDQTQHVASKPAAEKADQMQHAAPKANR